MAANPFSLEPQTNGQVTLHTTYGDVVIELWGQETPKACRNFVQLALEGYYDGCIFHRVIPNFIAQTGDPTGTGAGGESIYDEPFEDELNQRIKFNRRGLVAMANDNRKNTNLSQFFITLDRTEALQRKHTIFGRIEGDTIFNVIKFNDIEEFCEPPDDERPLFPPRIKNITVNENPFPDIVPRITAEERKEQEKAKKEAKKEAKEAKRKSGRKATKNKGLLSFGAEEGQDEEEENEEGENKKKFEFKASSDLIDAEQEQEQSESSKGKSKTSKKRERGDNNDEHTSKRRDTKRKSSEDEKFENEMLAKARHEREQRHNKYETIVDQSASTSEGSSKASKKDMRDEISKLEESLKQRSGKKAEEAKEKSKPSGASLLEEERQKYQVKMKKKSEDSLMDALDSFRTKLHSLPEEKEQENGEPNEEGEDLEDVDDEGWMSHKLVFRKDATLDRKAIEDYEVHDPLVKETSKSRKTLNDYSRDKNRKDRGDHRDRNHDRNHDRNRDGRRGGGDDDRHRRRSSGGERDDRRHRR